MTTVSIGQFVILCFAGLLCWALISDALTYKIPNRISLGIVGLYPAWVIVTWPRVDQPHIALAFAAGVLVAGFLAFDRGIIGGGDAKLLAAVSLWSGLDQFVPMIAVTAVSGGVIAIAIMFSQAFRWRVAAVRGDATGGFFSSIVKVKIPYGMAIAIGGGAVVLGLWTG